VSGIFSFHLILEKNFFLAAWLIAVSMFFDGLDGKIARLLNANSKFGAMFDTISDFLAFGIVPAFLAYHSSLKQMGKLGLGICIIYVCCGGFRLVRFMILNKNRVDKHSFLGLPIPAAASFIASFVILNHQIWNSKEMPIIFLFITIISSALMVSKIEYLAIEKRRTLTKEAKLFISLAVISGVLSIWFSYLVFVGWIVLYILYGIIRQIVFIYKK
jgi:CDP-diacylglycerol--serine O-phosphatidyltransferase